MDSINSNMGMGPEIYAMKKAIDVQSQAILKVLESTSPASPHSNAASGADLTGLGQNLDIKA